MAVPVTLFMRHAHDWRSDTRDDFTRVVWGRFSRVEFVESQLWPGQFTAASAAATGIPALR